MLIHIRFSMSISVKNLCVVALLAAAIISVLGQRRDDKWPPPQVVAYLKKPHDICIQQTGTTDDAIKAYSDTDATADEKLMCYMGCLFKEGGVVDDEGHLHLEKMVDGIEVLEKELQDIAVNMGKKCLRPEGKTTCETAGWYHACWKKADPTHYFLI